MESGTMLSNGKLKGVGIRLDQLQIERALQLEIENIPRISEPQATIYHTKMGFLPEEKQLIPLKSIKNLKHLYEEIFACLTFNINDISPIVLEENGKFYLDINRSIYNINFKKWKEIIKNHSLLDKIDFSFFDL